MAQYKVPQDVEADDKLLGPFSFRQFVYLLIAGGSIALAVALFQLFPALALIPVPFILFFGALALPLKKDQPMETYLAALISFYLKPRNRIWTPGQRESTIRITAPKIVEESRTRNITGEEATHRLSFLADIVDTEGRAINGIGTNIAREELIAEARSTSDMFETSHFNNLEYTINRDETERHEEVIKEMREAINKNSNPFNETTRPTIQKKFESEPSPEPVKSNVMIEPTLEPISEPVPKPVSTPESSPVSSTAPIQDNPVVTDMEENKDKKNQPEIAKSSIIELANNDDFSIATIAKEANRMKEKKEGEVFISLH